VHLHGTIKYSSCKLVRLPTALGRVVEIDEPHKYLRRLQYINQRRATWTNNEGTIQLNDSPSAVAEDFAVIVVLCDALEVVGIVGTIHRGPLGRIHLIAQYFHRRPLRNGREGQGKEREERKGGKERGERMERDKGGKREGKEKEDGRTSEGFKATRADENESHNARLTYQSQRCYIYII